jgi:hypothetical protein
VLEVREGAELLINYGNKLWFVDESAECETDSDSDDVENPFGRMEL